MASHLATQAADHPRLSRQQRWLAASHFFSLWLICCAGLQLLLLPPLWRYALCLACLCHSLWRYHKHQQQLQTLSQQPSTLRLIQHFPPYVWLSGKQMTTPLIRACLTGQQQSQAHMNRPKFN